jgi:hypothetical protein
MSTTLTQETTPEQNTPANPMPIFTGIIKIGPEDVTIQDDTKRQCDELTEQNKLTQMEKKKLHCTLGHQSIEGLKTALKAQKKALKRGDDDPIVLPETPLPVIDTVDSRVVIVEDVNPKNGDARKTVRIVLRQKLQDALASWIAELCNLNGFTRDEIELQRVFHVSYSNQTGLPGDSVR